MPKIRAHNDGGGSGIVTACVHGDVAATVPRHAAETLRLD